MACPTQYIQQWIDSAVPTTSKPNKMWHNFVLNLTHPASAHTFHEPPLQIPHTQMIKTYSGPPNWSFPLIKVWVLDSVSSSCSPSDNTITWVSLSEVCAKVVKQYPPNEHIAPKSLKESNRKNHLRGLMFFLEGFPLSGREKLSKTPKNAKKIEYRTRLPVYVPYWMSELYFGGWCLVYKGKK